VEFLENVLMALNKVLVVEKKMEIKKERIRIYYW